MPVDGGEPGRSVRDLQRGTDTLVAVHRGAPDRGGPRGQGAGERGRGMVGRGRESSNGGVLKMLSRRASGRTSERANERASLARHGPLPCRGIIGTPCIIACVPYTRCAVCDWIGGDGSREIADPN